MTYAQRHSCDFVSDVIEKYVEIIEKPTICYDHRGITKEEMIIHNFSELSYLYQYKNKIASSSVLSNEVRQAFIGCGKIFPDMKCLVVSHCDHVFNDLCGGKPTLPISSDSQYLRGWLDNAISNLVVLDNLKTLMDNHIGVLFTGYEEIMGLGAKKFVDSFEPSHEVFVINMDVTKRYVDMEFEAPVFELPDDSPSQRAKISEIIGARRFQSMFSFDDSVIFSQDPTFKAISYCIQTTGNMHSGNCKTKISSFIEYYKGFSDIVHLFSI